MTNANGGMPEFEFEKNALEAIKVVKSWLVERKYLVANKIKFNDYPEEI